MRVAIVHDYLTHFGGAERVLQAMMEAFPNAPVYTTVFDRKTVGPWIDFRRVRTSFLQSMPGAKRSHRYLALGMMPLAIEQLNFEGFDVVLSSSHSFGKGVILSPGTLHICYCFTPTRYAWDNSHQYVREFGIGAVFSQLVPAAISYIRLWDYYASSRVDVYITLSKYVAGRIRKYYGRDARVIAPPVSLDSFSKYNKRKSYYLMVSRLVPYKKIELAIAACEKMKRPLKIVGVGPELERLKLIADSQTTFLGFVSDKELNLMYQEARALIFPQEEDFGITPLEAAACGTPTIAYGAGGALETIIEGETGVFFDRQTPAAIESAIRALERREWDSNKIREHADKFGKPRFVQALRNVVQSEWEKQQQEAGLTYAR